MSLLFISFIAGILTVLAPCTLPLLPIIVGGSLHNPKEKWKPFLIACSLSLSIILFTLLLKFSTAFINTPQQTWSLISGSIILFFGLITLFPRLWEKIALHLRLSNSSNKLLGASAQKKSYLGDILIGLSLGPVFSSCSPTYFLILATVLPQNFATGFLYLVAYSLGLALILLLIAFLGQKIVRRLQWAANPEGWFKRILGILFIVVGLFILTETDKKVQTYILDKGYWETTQVEQKLLETQQKTNSNYPPYQEIVNPSGFVNTNSITLKELIGKKVILVDFMTYTCINCVRTFPYLNAWYDKYQNQGLEIVGIHTPEFAFEHKRENVIEAMKKYGIKFPIVLDNDYSTWKAYKNSYWPRKYLIDINGNIVYDHIGEGEYEETEMKIQELLKEREQKLGLTSQKNNLIAPQVQGEKVISVQSGETYFGADRNDSLGNGTIKSSVQKFTLPTKINRDTIYLNGDWIFSPEYAENKNANASIVFKYSAQKVFLVMSADTPIEVTILRDGKIVSGEAGADVKNGILTIDQDAMYRLIEDKNGPGEHTLEIRISKPGLKVFAFTFG